MRIAHHTYACMSSSSFAVCARCEHRGWRAMADMTATRRARGWRSLMHSRPGPSRVDRNSKWRAGSRKNGTSSSTTCRIWVLVSGLHRAEALRYGSSSITSRSPMAAFLLAVPSPRSVLIAKLREQEAEQ